MIPTSSCCGKPAVVAGLGTTHWYACPDCGNPVADWPTAETCPICEMPLAGSPQTDHAGKAVHTACLRDGMNEMYPEPETKENDK